MNSAAASCEGKVKFKTFTLANDVTKRHSGDKHREPYHCTHCRQWHLGTNNKADKRAKRAIGGGRS